MSHLIPADEFFVHQIAEPLAFSGAESLWRESCLFVVHGPESTADTLYISLRKLPSHSQFFARIWGRFDGRLVPYQSPDDSNSMRRTYDPRTETDPFRLAAGPVNVEIIDPFRRLRIEAVDPTHDMDIRLEFDARSAPYLFRRGRRDDEKGPVWDQRHIQQSGSYTGRCRFAGADVVIDGWVGQRDKSWGLRDHARVPLWAWVAIQFDEGVFGFWHWETEAGAVVFSDGYWASNGESSPVPMVEMAYDLQWIDQHGERIVWPKNYENVSGIEGVIDATFEDGRELALSVSGSWVARFDPTYHGGELLVRVERSDASDGVGIIELTGFAHRRLFPRAD